MTVPPGAHVAATLPAPFDVIVDLLSALPLGAVEWTVALVAALFIGAATYATRQRTPVVTLADHLDEIDSEVQS